MNNTPPLMPPEQFNQKVLGWTIKTRSKMIRNAPVGKERSNTQNQSLANSIVSRTKKYDNEIGRISFGFEKHGIYVHYGVGRGYIRQGDTVVRGSKKNEKIKTTGFNRKPNDWFDLEIKAGIKELAEISQEYYGDIALDKILKNMNKALIQKR